MNTYSETTTSLGAVLLTSCDVQNPSNDYWNIDDILAEEQIVPVKYEKDCRGLTFLDSLESQAVTQKAKLEAKRR